MTEYEKIVDKMIKKYPHARAAFQYFLEQSHYDSMEEFLFDYGYIYRRVHPPASGSL